MNSPRLSPLGTYTSRVGIFIIKKNIIKGIIKYEPGK